MDILILGFVAIGLTGLLALWLGRARSAPMNRCVAPASELGDVVRHFAAQSDGRDILVVQQGRLAKPFLQLARLADDDGSTRLVLNFPLVAWSKRYQDRVEEIATRHGATARRLRVASLTPHDADAPDTYLELDFGPGEDGREAAVTACTEIARDAFAWQDDASLTCLAVASRDAA
ncbi:MAG: hypothetical protein AAGC60_15295 [Acidobacteriota bacterium]